MIRWVVSIIGVLVFVFVIASLPTIMSVDPNGMHIYPKGIWFSFLSYIEGITRGQTFQYYQGLDRTRSFFGDVTSYFEVSYFYLVVAAFFSVIISTLLGLWQGKERKGWLKDLLGFLGAIPDFIVILLLQLGVASIYEKTGISVALVASKSTDEPAVFIPILTLSLIPAVYLVRTISEHTYDELTENYILTARSKGMKRIYILFRHAMRNVLPYVKADLHKVAAIMIGNLFIVEYLFNLRGLTRLVFTKVGQYQYDLVVNCLFAFIILYLLLYWTMRLFIFGLERIFAYD